MIDDIAELWVISKSTMILFWEKFMLAIIMTTLAQILEQFSASFGADTLLLLLLFSLLFIDIFLSYVTFLKKGTKVLPIVTTTLKIPLFCLYLFLVGVIAVSLEHSISFALPLLNLFIAYLAASETIVIISDLQNLGVNVPGLLVIMSANFKKKLEDRLQANKHDNEGGH